MIRIFLIPLSWLMNLLPLSFTQSVARFIADLFRWSVGFRAGVIRSNLKLAFPSKTETQIEELLKENYRHYSLTFLEILRSITWSKEKARREIEVQGYEILEGVAKAGGGFVLTSHLGNWEYSILGTSARGLPVEVVVKKSQTPAVENFLQWFRRRYGAGVLLESYTAREILNSVVNGRVVAVILDQFMGPPIGLPVHFFGKEAGTAVALSLFLQKRNVPVVPAYNYRDANGRIKVVIEKPLVLHSGEDKVQRLYQVTQLFNDTLEKHVRLHPEQWLWLHRRWKAFKGEPRWALKPAQAIAGFFLAFFLNACSSTGAATPTGIALPADPTIAVPKFEESKGEEVAPSPTPNPTLNQEVQAALKGKEQEKKNKKKKKEATVNPVTSTPSPTPQAVTIIPVDKIPFEIGEKLTIDLNWTALPAGRANLEVKEGPKFNGRETFHLWGNVLSSKLVDTIYHVDNTIEAFVDKQGLIPYKFLLHMVESKQLKETRVSFDHVNSKAHYWAKRISERWGNADIDRQDALTPQAKDMFSALYYARSLNYSMGKMQIVPVYENGQNWNIEVTPVAYEFVRSGVGAFQCWKLKITAKLNNVLAPTGDMYLWVSDDSKKYPVKFDAKIKIGSLLGSLTSIKER